jgi:fatty-acyl-CoA synthase
MHDDRSICALLNAQVAAHGSRVALTFLRPNDRAHHITYAQLGCDIRGVAAHLSAHGVGEGTVAVLALDHSYAVVQLFLGLLTIGARPVILPYHTAQSPAGTSRELAKRAVDSWSASVVIAVPSLVDRIRAVLPSSTQLFDANAVVSYRDDALAPRGRGAGDDVAYLQLSSGTTGAPRAVGVTHHALLTNLAGIQHIWRMTTADVCVGWLPLHHDLGLMSELFLPLLSGARSVLIAPGHWIRRPGSLLQAIDRYRGTITTMPNFAFAHAARNVSDAELRGVDLSSLKVCLCASELVYPDTLDAFRERFAPHGLRPQAIKVGYGMSEAVCGVTMTALDDTPKVDRRLGHGIVSCGPLFPGTEIQILDAEGRTLPEGERGEVAVRGGSICPAYYGIARAPISNEAGWFATGDIGYVADGQLYVCDRKKDLINIAGRHVFPHAIEAIAAETVGASIGGAAAFGVPDPRLGTETPVLVVGLRGGDDADKARAWAAEIKTRVSREHGVRIADVHFVRRGWLCRTTSGKVSRSACRDKYRHERVIPLPRASLDEGRLAESLMQIFQDTLGLANVGLDEDFFALGGDSLAALRMTLEIEERLGRELPAGAFDELSVANLVRVLDEVDTGRHRSPRTGERAGRGDALRRRLNVIRSIGARRWIRNVMMRRGPLLGTRTLAYDNGARFVAWLATQPWSARVLFRRQVDVVRRCLSLVEAADRRDAGAVVQQSIASNVWSRWRIAALERCAPSEFDRWVHVTGLPRLRDRSTDRGVVLVTSHAALATLLGSFIRRAGVDDFYSIGTHHLSPFVAQLHTSRQVLGRGGIIVIAADGRMGTSTGITVPFFGRSRPFKTGFAELALGTGASIVPVSVALDTGGRVDIAFSPPLEAARLNRPRQVRSLVLQYVDVLKHEWIANLGSFPWEQLEEFLDLPLTNHAA